MHPKKRTKAPPEKTAAEYRRLWKIVDGAVADAFSQHKEYIAPGIEHKVVRASVNKRVVGALLAASKDAGPNGNNVG